MYVKLNAINSASVTAIIGIIEYILLGWKEKNIIQKIVKILFIWCAFVELGLAIVVFILSLFGKIVNLFPIVNFVYSGCIYIIFMIAIFIGLISSLYSPKEYLYYVNSNFKNGLEQAYCCVGC